MPVAAARILMLTPFQNKQRGNSITSARLQNGLGGRGYQIDCLSLEHEDYRKLLADAVGSGEYGLIHAFNATYTGQALAAIQEMKALPLLLTTTGTDLHYDLLGQGRGHVLAALDTAAKIAIFNEHFRQIFLDHYPEAVVKLRTIPQGVVLEDGKPISRRQLGIAEDEFVFLLPSGLRPVKNIAMALNALQRLRKQFPRVRFMIIGAVIDEQYSREIIQRIGKLEWVSHYSEIPHEDMKAYLELGDVVLNTSQAEGQPQGALEAMSLGKPCLLTAAPGNLNLITAGVEGFYVHNEDELYILAKKLIEDGSLRLRMGAAARCLVENRFAPGPEIEAYHELYEELLTY